MENGDGGAEGRSALIFLGTGCSSAVPRTLCLIQPSDPPCHICYPSLSTPPDRNPNYRCNTSLLIDYCKENGAQLYTDRLERHSGTSASMVHFTSNSPC